MWKEISLYENFYELGYLGNDTSNHWNPILKTLFITNLPSKPGQNHLRIYLLQLLSGFGAIAKYKNAVAQIPIFVQFWKCVQRLCLYRLEQWLCQIMKYFLSLEGVCYVTLDSIGNSSNVFLFSGKSSIPIFFTFLCHVDALTILW